MEALILPQNYVEITEDEMMYLDGGWSAGTFGKNLYGLAERGGVICTAIAGLAKALGKASPAALKTLTGACSWVIGKVSTLIGKIVSLIGGFWAGFLAGLSAALAITYLGNNRVFY